MSWEQIASKPSDTGQVGDERSGGAIADKGSEKFSLIPELKLKSGRDGDTASTLISCLPVIMFAKHLAQFLA